MKGFKIRNNGLRVSFGMLALVIGHLPCLVFLEVTISARCCGVA